MKRILSTLMLLIALAAGVSAAERYAVYRVAACQDKENCGNKIKTCLKDVPGVAKVEYLPSRNSVVVTFDPAKTSTEAIGRKLEKAGIQATHCRPQNSKPWSEAVERGNCQQSLQPAVRSQAVKANATCRNATAVPQTKACARVDSACQKAGNCSGSTKCGKDRVARKAVRK